MAEKAYYTGEGVFHFDGKDYGHGKELPAAVPAESIDAMIKKGKASRKAPEKGIAVVADESAALRGKVQTLTEQRDAAERAASAGSVEIGRLQERIAELEKTGIEREELVASLTEQLGAATAVPVPVVPVPPPAPPVTPNGAAGPKK